MGGENKKIKRYRTKVVELNRKVDFMTELIMMKDGEIESLKRSLEIALEPEEVIDEQNREGDTEGQEDRPDLEQSAEDNESVEG